jgi:hypothetical protein
MDAAGGILFIDLKALDALDLRRSAQVPVIDNDAKPRALDNGMRSNRDVVLQWSVALSVQAENNLTTGRMNGTVRRIARRNGGQRRRKSRRNGENGDGS